VPDVTFFCVQNNIAFQGTNEVIIHQADFPLNLNELISHYNPLLKLHTEAHKLCCVHYLFTAVQNEFTTLLANQVCLEMINGAKNILFLDV
jgi:hypothetical protein